MHAILIRVCACGCIVPVAILAAVVYCALHGLWTAAALLLAALGAAALGLIGFGRKMLTGRPGRKPGI